MVSRKMRLILRKLTVKRFCYTSLILFLTSYVLSSFFFAFIHSNDFMYSFHQYLPDDVSCYFVKNSEDMYAEKYLNLAPANVVFMHYTSCHYNLKPAHLCAIEAASVAYPKNKIIVLFNKPLSFCVCQKSVIKDIMSRGNIEFIRLQIERHINATPFKNIIGSFKNSVLNRGMRRYKKVEEMLKLATLYNYGGKIIDMDVVVTAPVNDLNNWVIVENDKLNSATLAFRKKKDNIIKKSILSLPVLQDLKDDDLNISNAIMDVLVKLCDYKPNKVINLRINKKQCKELQVLKLKIHTLEYSDPATALPLVYAYRIIDEPKQYNIPNNSLLAEIAKKYCPIVYNFTLYSKGQSRT